MVSLFALCIVVFVLIAVFVWCLLVVLAGWDSLGWAFALLSWAGVHSFKARFDFLCFVVLNLGLFWVAYLLYGVLLLLHCLLISLIVVLISLIACFFVCVVVCLVVVSVSCVLVVLAGSPGLMFRLIVFCVVCVSCCVCIAFAFRVCRHGSWVCVGMGFWTRRCWNHRNRLRLGVLFEHVACLCFWLFECLFVSCVSVRRFLIDG